MLFSVLARSFLYFPGQSAIPKEPLMSQLHARLTDAAHTAATGRNATPEPTPAQKLAGNYRMGRFRLHGMDLCIENPEGTFRTGTDTDGQPWRTRLAAHYGYFAGTRGADGDPVDVFIGVVPESPHVWVVNQVNPDGEFDEHKVMLGFGTEELARAGYIGSYSPGWQGLGSMVRITLAQLRWWLKSGDRTAPIRSAADLLSAPETKKESTMKPVLWDQHATPMGQSIGKVLYDIRLDDVGDDLLTDPMTMDDALSDPDIEHLIVLDALVVEAGMLKPKTDQILAVLKAAGKAVQPQMVEIGEPVRLKGTMQIPVIYGMSDGQTLTIWFHNPDTTPAKLAPMDVLVSARWVINKKDVTIVVAPEKGKDLSPRDVARRIMALVEKNSAAFLRVNAKAGERAAQIEGLQGEIAGLEQTLDGLKVQLERAQEVRASAAAKAPKVVAAPAAVIPAQPVDAIATAPDWKHIKPADLPGVAGKMMSADQYAMVYGNQEAEAYWQDTLDNQFNQRVIDTRNAARKLGWDAPTWKWPMTNSAGLKLNADFRPSPKGSNIVGVTYQISIDGEGVAAIRDDLSKSPDALAAEIDSRAPVKVAEPEPVSAPVAIKPSEDPRAKENPILSGAAAALALDNDWPDYQRIRGEAVAAANAESTAKLAEVYRLEAIMQAHPEQMRSIRPYAPKATASDEVAAAYAAWKPLIRGAFAPLDAPSVLTWAAHRDHAEALGIPVAGGNTAETVARVKADGAAKFKAESEARMAAHREKLAKTNPGPGPAPVAAPTSPAAPAEPPAADLFGDTQPEALTPEGAESKVKTAKGTEVLTGYSVIEADRLITSHDPSTGDANPAFPAELQPRDRGRDASIAWVRKTANDLDPDLLGKSRRADSGAPIIGPDGVVESGNGRTMAVVLAYQSGKADDYRAWLEDEATYFGLKPEKVKAMRRPVLVRIRTSKVDRAAFAIEANQSDTLAMTATEKAKSDARRMDDGMIALMTENGDLAAAENVPFLSAFLRTLGEAEAAQYSTSDGKPTSTLIARVQAAIFAKAYADDRLLELTADVAKPEIANIVKALNHAAPEFIQAAAMDPDAAGAATGKLTDAVEKSLNQKAVDALLGASNVIRQAKDAGQSVEEFVGQSGLFGDIDPDVAAMAVFIAKNNRSAKRMGEAFKAMATFIKGEIQRRQTGDMFGDSEPVAFKDIVAAANRELERMYGPGVETIGLFDRPAAVVAEEPAQIEPVSTTPIPAAQPDPYAEWLGQVAAVVAKDRGISQDEAQKAITSGAGSTENGVKMRRDFEAMYAPGAVAAMYFGVDLTKGLERAPVEPDPEPDFDPVAAVNAAYTFDKATDDFKAQLADTLDLTDYSEFATAKGIDEAVKAAGGTVSWSLVVGAILDSVAEMSDGWEADDPSEHEGVFDSVGSGEPQGVIRKGTRILGRAVFGGDGKAMIYVGKAGADRVMINGQRAMWGEEPQALVSALFVMAGEVVMVEKVDPLKKYRAGEVLPMIDKKQAIISGLEHDLAAAGGDTGKTAGISKAIASHKRDLKKYRARLDELKASPAVEAAMAEPKGTKVTKKQSAETIEPTISPAMAPAAVAAQPDDAESAKKQEFIANYIRRNGPKPGMRQRGGSDAASLAAKAEAAWLANNTPENLMIKALREKGGKPWGIGDGPITRVYFDTPLPSGPWFNGYLDIKSNSWRNASGTEAASGVVSELLAKIGMPAPVAAPIVSDPDADFLRSVIDKTAPDMLDPVLADKIEAVMMRRAGDAEIDDLAGQAIDAYMAAAMDATAGLK
jgi:hypothetical protein